MNFIYIPKGNRKKHIIKKSGEYIFFIHNYSGVFDLDIEVENVNVFIYGIYVGSNNDIFELKTIQHHQVGRTMSDLLIKGVFFDDSKFHYQGLIKINKNAQKSNAYQKNQNILMSPSVFVDSRPYLEIEANNVRCTHGSTTGKISDETINFLNLRGLDQRSAQRLVLMGFINDVFDRISNLGWEKESEKSKIGILNNLEKIFDKYAN